MNKKLFDQMYSLTKKHLKNNEPNRGFQLKIPNIVSNVEAEIWTDLPRALKGKPAKNKLLHALKSLSFKELRKIAL